MRKVWVLTDQKTNLSVFKNAYDVISAMEVAGYVLEEDGDDYMLFSNCDGLITQHFRASLEEVR